MLVHDLAGPLHNAADAGLANEHVVRFLGQHEAAGARQGIEGGFRESGQLVLAVAVGEKGKHEEGQPFRRLFVEGLQDARLVRVAGVALQHGLGFLAAVTAEVGVQQVHHGPQVAAFLDVDLENIAQVVERRAGLAEVALLLDGGGLGVALGDDQAAQFGSVFPGNLLPRGIPLVHAEIDPAVLFGGGEENAPAVIGHANEIVIGPAAGLDADGRAQVNVHLLAFRGAHFLPPVHVFGLPFLQRALEAAVLGQIDVVGDCFSVIDAHGLVLICLICV